MENIYTGITIVVMCLILFAIYFEIKIRNINEYYREKYNRIKDKFEIERDWIKNRLANVERRHMDLDEDVSLLFKHLNLVINERETLKEIEPKMTKKKRFLLKITSKMR